MAENGQTTYREQLDRMRQSMRQSPGRASREYRAVMSALEDVVKYKDMNVGEAGLEMIEAHTKLGAACEKYLSTREGARTDRGKDRLGMIGVIHGLQQQEQEGINIMRSPGTRKENAGRKWNDVMAEQRIREIDVTGKELRTVGAGSSTRTVVPMGDDIGFFSENKTLMSHSEFYDNLKKTAKNPRVKAIYETMAENKSYAKSEWDNESSNRLSSDNFEQDMGKYIDQSVELGQVIQWDSLNQEEKGELLGSLKEVGKYVNTIATMSEKGNIEVGANISDRNVASTRLAQLLGQDSLLAKSEKVCLRDGDTIKEGVVMAKAIGVDLNSYDQADIKRFGRTEDFSDPNFQRQISNLEIIDYLAGQTDRNTSNMFYQFDEAGGKVKPVGIQGIDNDAAFGLRTKNAGSMVSLSKITIVDADLKQNIMQVDKNVLEYTFGDILNQKEIGALNDRFAAVKKQLQSAKEMNPGDWNAQTCAELSDNGGYLFKIKAEFDGRKKWVMQDETATLEKETSPEPEKKEPDAPEQKAPESTEKAPEAPAPEAPAESPAKEEKTPEIGKKELSFEDLMGKEKAETKSDRAKDSLEGKTSRFVIGGHRSPDKGKSK